MEKLRTEGVVINALPFRNHDCILTLFTPIEGLVKFFVRGAYSSKKGATGITAPLSIIEIVYTKGRSELYPCSETTVLNHHLPLRQNFERLQAACEMLQAISATQQPGKAAPELYRLLMLYLNRLPNVLSPQVILNSFRLKLLRYEGVLAFFSHCAACSELLNDAWLYENEAYCHSHKPLEALLLIKEDREMIDVLAFCRDMAILSKLDISDQFAGKIQHLFSESLK